MPIATHTFEQVTYQAAGRRWTFSAGEAPNQYSYTVPNLPGGRTTADKIAQTISKAFDRSHVMDNRGRAAIASIVHHAQTKTNTRMVRH